MSAGAGLDTLEKREISCPCRNSNPRPFSHYSLVTILTSLSRLLMFVSDLVKMVHLVQRRSVDHRHTHRWRGDLINLLFAPKRKQKAYKITRCLSVSTYSLETTDYFQQTWNESYATARNINIVLYYVTNNKNNMADARTCREEVDLAQLPYTKNVYVNRGWKNM